MPYDSGLHHRRSLRLKGYDYSQAGAYFVTICVQDHQCLFGTVEDGEMRLNRYGEAVTKAWEDLPAHYTAVELDAFVVMPNHVHAIVVLGDLTVPTGADLDGRAGLRPALAFLAQSHDILRCPTSYPSRRPRSLTGQGGSQTRPYTIWRLLSLQCPTMNRSDSASRV